MDITILDAYGNPQAGDSSPSPVQRSFIQVSPTLSPCMSNKISEFLTNRKKLCFDYLRGRCYQGYEKCAHRHPINNEEFERELSKLSRIDCKYGDECDVFECLYKHSNKPLYIEIRKERMMMLNELIIIALMHQGGMHMSSTNYNNLKFLGLYENEDNIPDGVRTIVNSRDMKMMKMSKKQKSDAFILFKEMNSNIIFDDAVVFDFFDQTLYQISPLVGQIFTIMKCIKANHSWVLVPNDKKIEIAFYKSIQEHGHKCVLKSYVNNTTNDGIWYISRDDTNAV